MTIDECARIEELISAQQDGAVTPEERAQIERHVAGCARCQATIAAYGQVDRQVRRYLMATPVPELATPWRNEPVSLPARRGGSLGHWRATAVGLVAIFALIFTASILAFQPFAPQQSQTTTGGGRPPADSAEGGAAPGAAQVAATNTPSAAFAAPAAPAQPTAAAAARGAGSPAVAAATRASGAAGAGAPSAAATATQASSAASAATTTSTRAPAPMAGAVADAPINPAQLYRLRESVALLICQPGCDTQAQPEGLRATVVSALDRPLTPIPPAAVASTPGPYLTLRFVSATGTALDIGYYPQAQRLQLPDGRGLIAAPPELVAALASIVQR